MSGVAWAVGGSAVLGGISSLIGAKKAGKTPPPRNLGSEIGGIASQVPGVTQAGLDAQQRYGGAYNALGNSNLRQGVLGDIDWNAYAKTPGAAQHIAESGDYYGGLGGEWTDAQKAQNYYVNGYGNEQDLTYTGGMQGTLESLQRSQDRANADSATYQRTRNIEDQEALGGRAAAQRRALNPEYFSALGGLNGAAGQPINASDYETEFGRMAMDPSATYANGAVRDVAGPAGYDRVQAGRVRGPGQGLTVTGPGAGLDVTGPGTGLQVTGPTGTGLDVTGPQRDSALLGALGGLESGGIDRGPLMAELNKQALAQLQTGGALTEQEAQQARNEARAAAEARGLSYSPGASADEILNLDKYRRERSAANQQFAQGVDAQDFAQRQAGINTQLAASDAARGYATLDQQAQMANQGNRFQYDQLGQQAQMANQGNRLQYDQLGQRAQELNQGNRLQYDQLGQQAQLANQGNRLGYDQLGQQTRLANQDADLRAQLANQGTGYQYAALGQQAQLANQQTDLARNAAGLSAADFNLRAANQRAQLLAGADAAARSRGTEQFQRQAMATQLGGQTLFDPASVLGGVDNRLNSMQTLGMGQQQYQGAPDYLSQLLNYGSDLYNTNYNGQAASNLNQANAYSALGGGLLGAAGQLGGAYYARG